MTSSTSPGSTGAFLWTNARVLVVEAAISEAAVAPWLPSALALAPPPTATFFVADYPETQFGSVYREAAVLLHAGDGRGAALHCPWMVVDEDTALILGREMLGFPKKLAEIALSVDEGAGTVLGTVCRRGSEVMRIEGRIGGPLAEPAPLFARRMVNAIGTPITGMKLIDLPPTEERIHSSRAVACKLTLASGERDPLGDLQAGPGVRARLVHLDFATAGEMNAAPQLLGDVDPAWLERRILPRAM